MHTLVLAEVILARKKTQTQGGALIWNVEETTCKRGIDNFDVLLSHGERHNIRCRCENFQDQESLSKLSWIFPETSIDAKSKRRNDASICCVLGDRDPDQELDNLQKFELGGKTFFDTNWRFQLEEAFWQHFKKLSAEVSVACQEHVTPLHK